MRFGLILGGFMASTAGAWADSSAPLELELDLETVAVIAPATDEDSDTQHALGEISLNARAEKILEDGTRLRLQGAFRLQKDHPARPGFTGGFGAVPGAPAGAFSGVSSGPELDQADIRARFETAYFQIDGGYGEVRIGKDAGVAARFHEGAPSVLTHSRLDSALLDPSGLSVIRTRHDLTGPSAKASYASPRILGLRAGISYSPEADTDGLDRRPLAGTGLSAPDIRNAAEIALNGTRRFRQSGVRVDAALAWSTAEVSDRAGLAPYQQVDTFSAGTRVDIADWTLGTSYLNSNNGLPDGDYSAWSAGLARDAFGIDWALNYGESEDDGARITSLAWQFGGRRELSKNVEIATVYSRQDISNPLKTLKSDSIVIEITLSTEILSLSGN